MARDILGNHNDRGAANGSSIFVYVTYIRTTPEKLRSALTDVELMTQYWFGVPCESQWTAESSWKMVCPDGRITDDGVIFEARPPASAGDPVAAS
jgi:uncharacterized protein YndB with AHSA1/START domain